jgi:hypothetical protein
VCRQAAARTHHVPTGNRPTPSLAARRVEHSVAWSPRIRVVLAAEATVGTGRKAWNIFRRAEERRIREGGMLR